MLPTTHVPVAPGAAGAGSHATRPADGTGPSATERVSQEVVRLVRSSQSMRAQIHARQGDGIEWAGNMLLFQLCKDGPARSSALAAGACVDPSTVSRQVSALVALGLVERRADPDDGRACLLAATASGEERHRAVRERRDRVFAHLLADWPQDDVRLLGSLLHRLNDSVIEHRGSLLAAVTGGPTTPTTTHIDGETS